MNKLVDAELALENFLEGGLAGLEDDCGLGHKEGKARHARRIAVAWKVLLSMLGGMERDQFIALAGACWDQARTAPDKYGSDEDTIKNIAYIISLNMALAECTRKGSKHVSLVEIQRQEGAMAQGGEDGPLCEEERQ